MQLSLKSRWQQVLFGLAALVCVAAYSYFALRSYAAYRASTQLTGESLRRAARLEPTNADYHHQLGLMAIFVDQDVNTAIEQYRAAVALNPHVAKYWLDLAEAYNSSGDSQAQAVAAKRAVEAEPTRPAIAWEAANLDLVQGDRTEALRLMNVVLKNEPQGYMMRAIDTSWRATHDADLIMREVLPADPAMYAAFLQLLIHEDRANEAAHVWRALTSLGKTFDVKSALPYFDYELNNRRPESAVQVWEYLMHMSSRTGDPGNLVFNGGFDQELLNGGFDWHFATEPHMKTDLDTTVVHGGNCSLLLTFDGEPVPETGIYHFIPAQPGSRYRFSAFEKAYELLTPSGPRFRISDAYTGEVFLETHDLLGSSVWDEVSGEFVTGSQTTLLKLTIMRNPSFQRISGRFWVDDVSLRSQ